MEYTEFLEELNSKSGGKKKLQIENITKFQNAVGNPEKQINGIHVAGTNGKGSTCAIIESILDAHNFKIGLNTSPHIVDYNERFRINKKRIEEKDLLQIYLKFRDLHKVYNTSFFEINTSLAFQIFFDESVDYAIMETGLGGRLDATKLVNSVVTAITNVDFDHMNSLGNTIEKIASEKAGIIKKNTPIILGKMQQDAKNTIIKYANEKNAPILEVEKEVYISNVNMTISGNIFDISIPKYNIEFQNLLCNLVGVHQIENTSTAILICAVVADIFNWKLDVEKVKQGLESVIWNGRMQKISDNPTVIIDGAHNPAGIEKLVFNLSNIYKYKKLYCVIAILYDKDFQLMIKNLSSIVDTFFVCKSNSDRAATTMDLYKEAKLYSNVVIEEDIKEAVKKAKQIASSDDLICVTGSLYTIGEAIR